MAQDVVFPNHNEESFLISAKKHGFSGLVFAYACGDKANFSEFTKEISLRLEKIEISSRIHYIFAAVLSKSTLNLAQSLKERGFNTLVDVSVDFAGKHFERDELDKYLRIVASSRYIDGVYGIERISTKKGLHYRNSGMNHIHAKMFSENHIVLLENSKDISPELARKGNLSGVMQNATLSRKYDFPMYFFSFAKNPEELSSYASLVSISRLFNLSSKDYFFS